MFEIRFHGRGGQGVVTSAELLATAGIFDGKYAQAKPSFGSERRGAPVQAFCRLSDRPIITRSDILTPDAIVVLDPLLIASPETLAGLKEGGYIIVNTKKSADEVIEKLKFRAKYGIIDATQIALNTINLPVPNTTILGSLLKLTNIVSVDGIKEALKERFGKLWESNFKAFEEAYRNTSVEVFNG